ncbi:centromere protein U isoform X1 [Ambystoma mexicanum]|uniref:centromere protein U isoform X1 n=1 Tax=Ambystoma mexicanum TaxID=8296 RepID=UPI0037E9A264
MAKKKGPKVQKKTQKKHPGFKELENIVENPSAKTSIEVGGKEGYLPPSEKYAATKILKNSHMLTPDISSILKEGIDNFQDDDLDDLYDHPLHSTAVADEGEEQLEQAVAPQTAKSAQQVPPSKKSFKKRKNLQNIKLTDYGAKKTKKNSEKENLKKQTLKTRPCKTSTNVNTSAMSSAFKSGSKPPKNKQLPNVGSDTHDEAGSHTSGFAVRASKVVLNLGSKGSLQTPADLSSGATGRPQRSQPISPAGEASSQTTMCTSDRNLEKSKGKKRKTLHEDTELAVSHLETGGDASMKIWCPDGAKRSFRDVTEFDIVLQEFQSIIKNYKHTVESVAYMKAIDCFFASCKEQLTGTIEVVQNLKNIQRQKAKINTDINKKRKHLLAVKQELLVTEPRVKQLEKEYAELEVKQSSLRIATQFLTDLKELQNEYKDYRMKHPTEKEKYGISSLPALLLESRSIVSAEKHLRQINSKLQHFLHHESEKETQ